MSDRRLIALHEAAHAVANTVLNVPMEYASIRPGRRFLGVAVAAPREGSPPTGFDPDHVVAMQPPDVRAEIERRIITTLAGEIAALYLADAPARTGYSDDDSETIAASALAALGPRVAELVVEDEQRDEPLDADETRARSLADAFAGPEAGAYYLEWLRAEARELVIRYRSAILRVADALERHAVLSGEQIAALVRPSKGTSHAQP